LHYGESLRLYSLRPSLKELEANLISVKPSRTTDHFLVCARPAANPEAAAWSSLKLWKKIVGSGAKEEVRRGDVVVIESDKGAGRCIGLLPDHGATEEMLCLQSPDKAELIQIERP